MERQFRIILHGQSLYNGSILKGEEREFTLGYLIATSTIHSPSELVAFELVPDGVEIDILKRDETLASPSPQPMPTLPLQLFFGLMTAFRERAMLYKDTGISHSVALANKQGILHQSYDIYLHQALYKLIGHCANSPAYQGSYLLLSGKLTFETMKLCLFLPCKWVITRSAPTDLALDLAVREDIGLIGFARGSRFICYHGQVTSG